MRVGTCVDALFAACVRGGDEEASEEPSEDLRQRPRASVLVQEAVLKCAGHALPSLALSAYPQAFSGPCTFHSQSETLNPKLQPPKRAAGLEASRFQPQQEKTVPRPATPGAFTAVAVQDMLQALDPARRGSAQSSVPRGSQSSMSPTSPLTSKASNGSRNSAQRSSVVRRHAEVARTGREAERPCRVAFGDVRLNAVSESRGPTGLPIR